MEGEPNEKQHWISRKFPHGLIRLPRFPNVWHRLISPILGAHPHQSVGTRNISCKAERSIGHVL